MQTVQGAHIAPSPRKMSSVKNPSMSASFGPLQGKPLVVPPQIHRIQHQTHWHFHKQDLHSKTHTHIHHQQPRILSNHPTGLKELLESATGSEEKAAAARPPRASWQVIKMLWQLMSTGQKVGRDLGEYPGTEIFDNPHHGIGKMLGEWVFHRAKEKGQSVYYLRVGLGVNGHKMRDLPDGKFLQSIELIFRPALGQFQVKKVQQAEMNSPLGRTRIMIEDGKLRIHVHFRGTEWHTTFRLKVNPKEQEKILHTLTEVGDAFLYYKQREWEQSLSLRA